MAKNLSAAFRETQAVAATNQGATFSLHTVADPGTGGASEVTGGGYTRKTTTWAAGAVDGSVPGSQMEFDIPAGVTLRAIGCWSGSSLLWTQQLPNDDPFSVQSKYYLTVTLTTPQGV